MILNLVSSNDPILKTPTQPFDFENPQMDPKQLAEDLAETMQYNRGVGLSASQCGIPLSVFVVGDPTNKDSIMAFFNPKIVDFSSEHIYYEEGCLSFPKLFIKIKRPVSIRMRFTDFHNETTTLKYTGFTSRIIQHEYSHLQGDIFTNKATYYHLTKAKKAQKSLLRSSQKNTS